MDGRVGGRVVRVNQEHVVVALQQPLEPPKAHPQQHPPVVPPKRGAQVLANLANEQRPVLVEDGGEEGEEAQLRHLRVDDEAHVRELVAERRQVAVEGVRAHHPAGEEVVKGARHHRGGRYRGDGSEGRQHASRRRVRNRPIDATPTTTTAAAAARSRRRWLQR